MADLIEIEVKDCWRTNMLGAADDAKLLAILPAQGPTYARLRERLRLAEGACRQMAAFRGDARWLPMAFMLNDICQRARAWIVAHFAREVFLTLERELRKCVAIADTVENKKTGISGLILPAALPLTRTEGRPVQVIAPV